MQVHHTPIRREILAFVHYHRVEYRAVARRRFQQCIASGLKKTPPPSPAAGFPFYPIKTAKSGN
jgi:hypothetical protein